MSLTSTERSRLWRERHKGADAAKSKKYRDTPKGRENEAKKSRKRRALKSGGKHENYTESQVLDIYGTRCNECNIEIDLNASRRVGYGNWEYGLHIDHYVPLAEFGDDTLANVRPTHAICNMRKGSRV